MLKLRGYIFLALLVFFLPPLVARANIGVSPSVIECSLLSNSESRQIFHFTRSGEELDTDLTVNITTNSPYIDLEGKDSVILPVGEQESSYIFSIKSADLKLGKYEAIVYFSPDIKKSGVAGNGVKYVLGAKVDFEVADKIKEAIDATLMPQDQFIKFGKIEAGTFFSTDEKIKLKSSLKNSSENSFKRVPYKVEVYKGGAMISNLKTTASQSLLAGKESPIEYSYTPEKIGRYTIVFSNENYKESKTIIVLPTFSYFYNIAKGMIAPIGEKVMIWWLNR
jgi:hypothetical protein